MSSARPCPLRSGTAEEASKLRICKHEAATLGEALEKAEA